MGGAWPRGAWPGWVWFPPGSLAVPPASPGGDPTGGPPGLPCVLFSLLPRLTGPFLWFWVAFRVPAHRPWGSGMSHL